MTTIEPDRVHKIFHNDDLDIDEIAEKLSIGVADVHFLLGSYYRVQSVDEPDLDTTQKTRADTIAPTQDIDVVHHNIETLHIERMHTNSVWFCAYTDDDDHPDYHYTFIVNGGGDGLSVHHDLVTPSDSDSGDS